MCSGSALKCCYFGRLMHALPHQLSPAGQHFEAIASEPRVRVLSKSKTQRPRGVAAMHTATPTMHNRKRITRSVSVYPDAAGIHTITYNSTVLVPPSVYSTSTIHQHWVVSGPCCPDRFVPGPIRVCPGRGSGRCGGLCRSVVLIGPGPRSVCVAPFASGPSLCL